jgi:hypothetical protein
LELLVDPVIRLDVDRRLGMALRVLAELGMALA